MTSGPTNVASVIGNISHSLAQECGLSDQGEGENRALKCPGPSVWCSSRANVRSARIP